jgi:hypothetical protein
MNSRHFPHKNYRPNHITNFHFKHNLKINKPFLKAVSNSTCQEIFHLLCIPKLYYRLQEYPFIVPILGRLNPFNINNTLRRVNILLAFAFHCSKRSHSGLDDNNLSYFHLSLRVTCFVHLINSDFITLITFGDYSIYRLSSSA